MGARYVPVVIQVSDGSSKQVVGGLKNAFHDLDQAGTRAAKGGMTNALSSVRPLNSEFAQLAQRVPLLGSALSRAEQYFLSTAKAVGVTTSSLKTIGQAETAITSSLTKAFKGDVGLARFFKDIGVSAEEGLRKP